MVSRMMMQTTVLCLSHTRLAQATCFSLRGFVFNTGDGTTTNGVCTEVSAVQHIHTMMQTTVHRVDAALIEIAVRNDRA